MHADMPAATGPPLKVWGAAQEEGERLRKGDMKADLLRRVKGFTCNMEDMVAHTPADHIFLNRIGDRCRWWCQ